MPGAVHPRRLPHLVGLGPGLTPSGDDFLFSVMFTLHALGHGAVAERLWDCAPDKWTALSFETVGFARHRLTHFTVLDVLTYRLATALCGFAVATAARGLHDQSVTGPHAGE